MALTTTATVSVLKPTSSVHLQEGSTNKVFYTVPDGKFFKGYVGHSSTSNQIKINGKDFFTYTNASNSNNTGMAEVILYAGDTLSSQSGGNFYVHGCLYDL
tara:strand:+ start:1218 stop:1520 length:303 start_codon:yes stop_codon:yes gene_type:complete